MNCSFAALKTAPVRRAQPLLGTMVEITAEGPSPQKCMQAVQKSFERIALVHRLMSFHDEISDVSRVNRQAGQKPVRVCSLTYEVIKTACRICRQTGGLFDCTIADTLIRWGYLPQRFGRRSYPGTSEDIELLSGFRVKFHRPLLIDLGGIAKGFAVDEAVEVLQSQGVDCGVVNAGGDLKIFGHQPQPVYVRSPANDGEFILLTQARDAAVATSGHYFSLKQWRGKKVTALVNPKNHTPCVHSKSVSVLARDCMSADALTKVVSLSVSDPDEALLKKFSASAIILEKHHHTLRMVTLGFRKA